MISDEDFLNLRKDVKDIKSAILGNPKYGQEGLISRVETNENEIESIKHFKNKFVYWVAGAAAAATVLFNIVMRFI